MRGGLLIALVSCGEGQALPGDLPPAHGSPGSVNHPVAGTSTSAAEGTSGASPAAAPFLSPLQPRFLPTVSAPVVPPPISGGTLAVARDGRRAFAADPDRDRVYVADLVTDTLVASVALTPGDEPGRLVEDGAGRVHVALRAAGALATIDPDRGVLVERRPVCPAPRGLAWDATTDSIWVACATGELVALPASGGPATQSLVVERDLRDVLAVDGALTVSELRSAQVLRLGAGGAVVRRDALVSPRPAFVPHVAWRTVAGPGGTVIAVHEAEGVTSLVTSVRGGYGGACGGPVQGSSSPPPPPPSPPPAVDPLSLVAPDDAGTGGDAACAGDPGTTSDFVGQLGSGAQACVSLEAGAVLSVLTVLASDGSVLVNRSFPGVLPVDVAVSTDGTRIAAVAPGNAFVGGLPTVFLFTPCGGAAASYPVDGQPIAAGFDASDDVVVQTREPASLTVIGADRFGTIALSPETRRDTGHDVFHTQAGALIACASCHPEGGEDGHVWVLDGDRRRTPSLRGTIQGTAPYHWPGDKVSFEALADDVYTVRMSGAALDTPQMASLRHWVESAAAPPPPSWVDPGAAARGRALFERVDVGCSNCHAGPKLTNSATLDVGTGGAFQVPSLIGVGWRTPLMHDGCARTLLDRFGACATDLHGSTRGLSTGEVADLVSYLETL
jgi:hypothetical protein